jgi:hypothetical protein
LHYLTAKKAAYDYKGNPLLLKSQVDVALREDLRANHFNFKGSACVIDSTASKNFKKLSEDQIKKSRQQFVNEKALDLRKSHFVLGTRTEETPKGP